MRGKRISTKIAVLVGIVEIVAMAALFMVINHNMTTILEKKAFSDMDVIAKDRAQLVETYIQGCCDYIDGYSKAQEIREVLEHPDDPESIRISRDYTNLYASGHEYMEGLYVAQWDTYVLAHINPDSVDKTFRDADAAAALEDMVKAAGKPFCTGIVLAPVTKKMVIPIYAPVYDENGEAIGFVGAAFYTDGLEHQFSILEDDESAHVGYSLINAATGVYIFDNDAGLVGSECTDQEVLAAVTAFKEEGSGSYYNFSNQDRVASCYYMADRDWVFVVNESGTDVFGTVIRIRTGLIIACLVITLIMVIMCVLSVDIQMRPLKAINDTIIRLQANDFTQASAIDDYCVREDEFGTIAKAVKDLRDIMQDQYELFIEMLKAQTVGMLVMDSETNEIQLINAMALKQLGFSEYDEKDIKIEDIYARIDEDQINDVRDKVDYIKKSDNQTTFELTVTHEDGTRRNMMVYANGVTLSNGKRLRIYSQVDITERKELEQNLLILSETDALTGICNRRSGECRIENALKDGTMGMFCLFDVNKFKYVNDTFGHAVGDQVLIGIAETMKKTFRTSDVLIRLGGDEFVVYAANVSTEDIGKLVIDRFLGNLEKFELDELNGHKITVSLGAVMVGDHEPFADLYSKADSLMYTCKKQGGNAYEFYAG